MFLTKFALLLPDSFCSPYPFFEMHLEGLNVSGCRPTFLSPVVSHLSTQLKWRFWERALCQSPLRHILSALEFPGPSIKSQTDRPGRLWKEY